MLRRYIPGLIALAVGGAAAHGQVINFHAADNGQGTRYAAYNSYNLLYYGQGAYSDPGNNIWNGFGNNPGAGSTYFYGPGLPNNPNLPGNPGNPYAWSQAGTASGSNLFNPAHYGASNVGNATSAGQLSSVTLTLSLSGENGLGNVSSTPANGTPGFLLGEAALALSGTLGTFTLGHVAQGTYDLYLYGANYDYTRGAAFNITEGGGTAVGGFTSTLNGAYGGTKGGPFILGDNYVEFANITVGADGTISGTWGDPGVNPISGLSGEGDFNGLQLVTVPEPSTFALIGLGIGGLLSLRRRK